MGRASIGVALLALLCAACGGRTATGSSSGQSGNGGPVACVAAGGQCAPTGSNGLEAVCLGQISTLSCGESGGAALYCCLPLDSGVPLDTDAADAGASDDGDTGMTPGASCPTDCVPLGGQCLDGRGGYECPNGLTHFSSLRRRWG